MNAWELSKELVNISSKIEIKLDEKSKVSKIDEKQRIDREIDALEAEFLMKKHRLQTIDV